jgi:hypothetical protein
MEVGPRANLRLMRVVAGFVGMFGNVVSVPRAGTSHTAQIRYEN